MRKTMDEIEKIKQLVSLMNDNDLAEIEMEEPDLRVRLKSQSAFMGVSSAPAVGSAHVQTVNPQLVPASDVEEEADAGPGGRDNLVAITSPMVGTFYRAPSEGAEPYVTVGSFVEPDTVVCIVEAMKVMNEVKADVAGEIVEILVQNGEPVEYGQELFMVKPAGGGD
jgi:acetyl-CoA carboxylase biotin carboxyl carrier protein